MNHTLMRGEENVNEFKIQSHYNDYYYHNGISKDFLRNRYFCWRRVAGLFSIILLLLLYYTLLLLLTKGVILQRAGDSREQWDST